MSNAISPSTTTTVVSETISAHVQHSPVPQAPPEMSLQSTTRGAHPLVASREERLERVIIGIEEAEARGVSEHVLMRGAERLLEKAGEALAQSIILEHGEFYEKEKTMCDAVVLRDMLGVLDRRARRHNRFGDGDQVALIEKVETALREKRK